MNVILESVYGTRKANVPRDVVQPMTPATNT